MCSLAPLGFNFGVGYCVGYDGVGDGVRLITLIKSLYESVRPSRAW